MAVPGGRLAPHGPFGPGASALQRREGLVAERARSHARDRCALGDEAVRTPALEARDALSRRQIEPRCRAEHREIAAAPRKRKKRRAVERLSPERLESRLRELYAG